MAFSSPLLPGVVQMIDTMYHRNSRLMLQDLETRAAVGALMLVFSVVDVSSFNAIETLLSLLQEAFPGRLGSGVYRIILVGTKIDLRTNPKMLERLNDEHKRGPITFKEAEELAHRFDFASYVEVSCVNKEPGIEHLKTELVNIFRLQTVVETKKKK